LTTVPPEGIPVVKYFLLLRFQVALLWSFLLGFTAN
jgi:hypothetical protein